MTELEKIDFRSLNSDFFGKSFGSEVSEKRLIVEFNQMPVPLLVRINPQFNSNLMVTYNGALQRSKAPDGIVFQRSSWLDEVEASVIQLADPTLVVNRKLQIGWGQFSQETWSIDTMAEIVSRLREVLDLPTPQSTLHYGSSAGGFQAIAVSTLDTGSQALVNNPQLDWSRYVQSFVGALMREVFGGMSITELKQKAPWRVNLVDYFDFVGNVPSTTILSNLASSGDLEDQLTPFLRELGKTLVNKIDPRVNVRTYSHSGLGHNPLPKAKSLELINQALGHCSGSR